jgi:hypothetical protein
MYSIVAIEQSNRAIALALKIAPTGRFRDIRSAVGRRDRRPSVSEPAGKVERTGGRYAHGSGAR